MTLLQLFDDVGFTGGGEKRRHPVFLGDDVVVHRPGLDHAWPADDQWNAEAAFPGRSLLAVERGDAAVGPRKGFRTVVRAVDDDRVLVDARGRRSSSALGRRSRRAPPCRRDRGRSRFVLGLLFEPCPDVHASTVIPDKERLLRFVPTVDEIHRGVVDFFVDRLHPLSCQRPGILDATVGIASESHHAGRTSCGTQDPSGSSRSPVPLLRSGDRSSRRTRRIREPSADA